MQVALRTSEEDGTAVVHVSGSLGAAGVPLLRDVLRAGSGRVAVLDLRELVSASAEGIAVLRHICASGVRVRNASAYLTLRLGEAEQAEE